MSLSEGEILDVGSARLTHPKPIEAEEDGKRGMALVEALGREEERAQLPAIQASPLRWVDLGSSNVLCGVGVYPAVDVSKAVEAADGGQPSVDGGRRKTFCSIAVR